MFSAENAKIFQSYALLARSRAAIGSQPESLSGVISGRSAVEVIDELEVLFRRHYEKVANPEM